MYILECSDGSYYTGSTWNLEERMSQHMTGSGGRYTGLHQPVKLVYLEEYDRLDAAYSREKQIQGWTRRKKKALIEGNFDKLIQLSKSKSNE
jgi:putative endonuclease